MLDVGGRYFITGTPGRRDWLANLKADPTLVVHLKRRELIDLPAVARIVEDEATRRDVLDAPVGALVPRTDQRRPARRRGTDGRGHLLGVTLPNELVGGADSYRGLMNVTSEAALRAVVPAPPARAWEKESDHLNDDAAAFVAVSPFAVLATADADGRCDASPAVVRPGSRRWSTRGAS